LNLCKTLEKTNNIGTFQKIREDNNSPLMPPSLPEIIGTGAGELYNHSTPV
jgi:hypothetical protein